MSQQGRRRARRISAADYDRSSDVADAPAHSEQPDDVVEPEELTGTEFYENEKPPHYGGE